METQTLPTVTPMMLTQMQALLLQGVEASQSLEQERLVLFLDSELGLSLAITHSDDGQCASRKGSAQSDKFKTD